MKQRLEQAILDKDKKRIESYIKEYEKERPTDFDIFSYKIALFLIKEDYQQAHYYAKCAVSINPFDIEANYNLMVCAEQRADYAGAYQAFLMVQFLQTQYHLNIMDDKTLAVWEERFQMLVTDEKNLHLKQEFRRIEKKHYDAVMDPFKMYNENLCGKILQIGNDEFYYVGLADNQYDSYFNPSFTADPIHAKCELFRIRDIASECDITKDMGKVLVPVCLNYDVAQKENNYIVDASRSAKTFYMEGGEKKYCYIPVEDGAALRTGYPAVFGTPIPLAHQDTSERKKVVLNIFIDSFNYYLIKEMGLGNLMPETERFFSKGTICDNYYAGSEWTLPSIATYWTGKHSAHHMNLMENYRFDFMKESKGLAEYFHDAGYVTAKIGGNDAITPSQGYIRGIDRFIYQSTQSYRKKEVIGDVLQQLETFKDACQFIWLDLVDLHHIAGGFMRSILVQSQVPLSKRAIDNDIKTSVKQTYSQNRREIYIQELREMDFYLGILYKYLEQTYADEDMIISLFSDHGTSFMVQNDKPFLSKQRVNVPFMIRGANVMPQTCDEIIESADYAAILCHLAGINYDYEKTDANLPVVFGGTTMRKYAFAHSIFLGDPYRAALHGKNIHYYMESKEPISPCMRINLDEKDSFLLDSDGKKINNPTLLKECESIVKNEISHLILES